MKITSQPLEKHHLYPVFFTILSRFLAISHRFSSLFIYLKKNISHNTNGLGKFSCPKQSYPTPYVV
jgi:hypothetical protein